MSASKTELVKILTEAGVEEEKAKGIAEAIAVANKKADGSSGSGIGTSKVIGNFQEYLKTMQKQELGMDRILDKYSRIINSSKLYREELQRFSEAGYNRSFTDFSLSIDKAISTSLKLTGNLKAAEKALSGLKGGFRGFGLISKEAREEFTNLSTTLAAAGFEIDSFGRILDSSTFAFGSSRDEIASMSAQLINLQRNLAIAPKELTDNFEYAQKNFAYTSGKIMENFAKLSKMSRETGLDFKKLAGSFGDSMDTFEGAAQMAGGLNQILGGSVFNSVELLAMDEATRAQTIRQRVQQRMATRGKNVGQLDKFELKAIAARLNMSTEEARRFLRTGELGKGMEGPGGGMQKIREVEMKGFEEASSQAADMGSALEDVAHDLRRFRKPLEMAYMAMEERLSTTVLGQTPTEFQPGLTGEKSQRGAFGLSTGNLSEMPVTDFDLKEAMEMALQVTIFQNLSAKSVTDAKDMLKKLRKGGLKGAALEKAAGTLFGAIAVGAQVTAGEMLIQAAKDRNTGATAPGSPSPVKPIDTKKDAKKTGAGSANITNSSKYSGFASLGSPVGDLVSEMQESNRLMREFIHEQRMSGRSVTLGVEPLSFKV